LKEKGAGLYVALLLSTLAAILILPLLFGFSEIVFLILYGESPNLIKLFQTMLSVMQRCIPFVVLIGVPAFLLIWNFSHINYFKMGTAGFLLGITIIIIVTRSWNLIISENFPSILFSASLLGGIPGMVSALTFYFVWHRVDSK
jgi:hypothetical protein